MTIPGVATSPLILSKNKCFVFESKSVIEEEEKKKNKRLFEKIHFKIGFLPSPRKFNSGAGELPGKTTR